MRLSDEPPNGLGCDSLEFLWLSSAVAEMFDLAAVERHHVLTQSDRFGAWLDVVEEVVGGEASGSVTFSTSGSTGRPKRFTHSFATLDEEAGHFAERFGSLPEPTRRVLAFVEPHHIYGFLFNGLLPKKLEAELLEGEAAARALAAPRPGDLVVGFPERWQSIERIVRRWPPGVHGVTSTAPCPRDLVETLIDAGLGGMTEIYGSSETAGIATRTWPAPAYQLLPRWRFVGDEEEIIVDRQGVAVPMPDVITRFFDGSFVVSHRHDGAVQVGGTNVYPERIAAALRDRPGVRDAAVRLMRPDEGQRLKAFIVAKPGHKQDDICRALTAWIRDAWEPASRPSALTFGAQLPRNALGKLLDW